MPRKIIINHEKVKGRKKIFKIEKHNIQMKLMIQITANFSSETMASTKAGHLQC